MTETKNKRFGEVVFEGDKVQVGESILFVDVYKVNNKLKIQQSRLNLTDNGEVFAKVGRTTYKETGVLIEGLTAAREYIKKEKAETEKKNGKVEKKKATVKVARKVEDEDAE